MARWMIDRDDVSSLVILRYAPKTNRVKTSLLGLTELLMALKNIWSTKSDLMSGILVVTIK